MAGSKVPEGIDGISVLPAILEQSMPQNNRFMYWEFHEGGFFQAVRWENWKAVREGVDGQLKLNKMISVKRTKILLLKSKLPEDRTLCIRLLESIKTEIE